MSGERPIACSLSGPGLAARLQEIRALGEDGLVDVVEELDRAVLRFRPEPGVRERLEAIAAAESECCAFLDFKLEHGDDATVLTISAPDGGGEVVHELVGAFRGPPLGPLRA
ncbi:MAG: hypothetical protein QOE69_1315 [Thermoleophilaceae bacterium]|jgi:hypothetical protein|nr:hypothetical protein [Thermoleophilaceae bacterium]